MRSSFLGFNILNSIIPDVKYLAIFRAKTPQQITEYGEIKKIVIDQETETLEFYLKSIFILNDPIIWGKPIKFPTILAIEDFLETKSTDELEYNNDNIASLKGNNIEIVKNNLIKISFSLIKNYFWLFIKDRECNGNFYNFKTQINHKTRKIASIKLDKKGYPIINLYRIQIEQTANEIFNHAATVTLRKLKFIEDTTLLKFRNVNDFCKLYKNGDQKIIQFKLNQAFLTYLKIYESYFSNSNNFFKFLDYFISIVILNFIDIELILSHSFDEFQGRYLTSEFSIYSKELTLNLPILEGILEDNFFIVYCMHCKKLHHHEVKAHTPKTIKIRENSNSLSKIIYFKEKNLELFKQKLKSADSSAEGSFFFAVKGICECKKGYKSYYITPIKIV